MASLKRWTRLLAGPALALAATAAVAGCSAWPSATATPNSTASPAAAAGAAGPGLTQAQAGQTFAGYVATTAKAARTKDSALALSVVTGVQQQTLTAALDGGVESVALSSSSGSSQLSFKPNYAQYSYGKPAFYLPEPAGFPRYFVADVNRTFTGMPSDPRLATWIAGAKVPVDGHVLMVFEQASPASAWQLASVSQLSSGVALPRLATDKNGYIPQVPLTTTSLLARPDVTGPLQAAVVDDGPASAAAKAVAAGPLTTGLYQGARAHVIGLTAPRGDIYQWELEGSPFPALALRTASGGALVLYAMYLNSTVEVPDVLNKATPVRPGLPIAVPPNFLPLLPRSQAAPRDSLEVQHLLSFAAIDPVASPSKVTVIAIGGGPDYATAS